MGRQYSGRTSLLRTLALLATLFVIGIAAACSDDGSAQESPLFGTTENIAVAVFTFTPADIAVPPGTTIVWTNSDEILHTVTSGEPEGVTDTFNGELDGAGTTFSFTFDEPGDYSYFCARHNGMRGTVTVTG